ncbi:MAG: 1-deoxy-D-xylulose-5-phosphate reductoisomerase [SAR324 cluster bacterium]|uniref:1-deoxy-D-xylulose 5-phosphate reductoisomerase n=1 Tax=SAR324 cluster bacterium TaxID=2024889 RepID=A0A2D6YMW2_9DELT|nr:1-deoxy-D-xylulose-5-phosphate reductoisomerase [SAR324 cluster bacterium]MAH64738.1 1-deoxy-D-xylulose-5-phosphate reductoisomerase [SAR324 cluster bacterium]
MNPKFIALLGSTGSIGRSTLSLVRQFPDRFKIHSLSCRRSIDKLVDQIKEFSPKQVVVEASDQVTQLRELFAESELEILSGDQGNCQLVQHPEVDLVVTGIVGSAGLSPCLKALEYGKDLVFGNKESLVLAGELFMQVAHRSGSLILPMDSEHNAIYQSLAGHRREDVISLILTASGGPFRDLPLDDFSAITKKDALQHPNWEMGNKITIDSATMMNKGLEVIEAHWLFGIPLEKIEVVIHRESIVHSLVEYVDGSLIAQLGQPDMRIPLAYCLGYPERLPLKLPRLNLCELGSLHFENPDPVRYPCFALALAALRQGGAAPAVLNGGNEAVVEAFLDEELRFIHIASYLQRLMSLFGRWRQKPECPNYLQYINSVDDALAADRWGRSKLRQLLETTS